MILDSYHELDGADRQMFADSDVFWFMESASQFSRKWPSTNSANGTPVTCDVNVSLEIFDYLGLVNMAAIPLCDWLPAKPGNMYQVNWVPEMLVIIEGLFLVKN